LNKIIFESLILFFGILNPSFIIIGLLFGVEIIGSFSSDYEYDYEYKIRQAKRMVYAYAIPYWHEKVVAVAHLSTKLWRNLVVPHDDL
jgi:hypothetical protein